MSIEIPNVLNSAGVFANVNTFSPTVLSPTPILSSQGILPYDAAQGPGNFVGGLTRSAAGNYVVRQVSGIDLLEGIAVAQCQSPAANIASAVIIPAADVDGLRAGEGVGVSVHLLSDGSAVDDGFQMFVTRFTTGPQFAGLS